MRHLIFFFIFIMAGCQTVRDCQHDPSRDYMIIRFFNAADSTEKPVTFEYVLNPDSQYNFVNPEDTLYRAMTLPLNPLDTFTHYRFVTDSTDFLLDINYQTRVFLYSEECEPGIFFFDLEVTSDSFDSVALITDELYKFLPNVEIYF